MISKIETIAVETYLSAMRLSSVYGPRFKLLVDDCCDGSTKPLLIFGDCEKDFRLGGYFIALKNPQQTLIDEITTGGVYTASSLKEKVRGRCDLMLLAQVHACRLKKIVYLSKYRARKISRARFVII